MLFNSWVFVGFFLIAYTVYLLLMRRLRAQNILLLIASYIFYGYWDWRFLSLLGFSTVVDFLIATRMDVTQDQRARRKLLLLSVGLNLTILGFFKYCDFFLDSTLRLLALIGWHPGHSLLQIVLPVGVSFYTFQALSYTVDVYRRDLKPTRSLVDFALYVAFFPQLVAGPIERATRLLPQVCRRRQITAQQVQDGIALLCYGFFKKVVVADNLALIANQVFNDYAQRQGLEILIGIIAFAIQIYGDFSGYSDIARGLSKLMGFELMVNFNLPYFSTTPQEFWSRWHISLSTWLRDYLYIPLGGSRRGTLLTYRNLLLTMILGGLWHGAAWHFVMWGLYQGLLLVGYRLVDRGAATRESQPIYCSPWRFGQMLLMLVWTMVGWVIFRATSLEQISYMLTHVGFVGDWHAMQQAYLLFFFAAPLIAMEWWQYVRSHHKLRLTASWQRGVAYATMLAWICVFGVRQSSEFIYFQF